MELQKLNVKIFTTPPDLAPLTDFIDVFHGWIQASDGDYHDVADYSHMTAGPGIVLIANDANVSIDENGDAAMAEPYVFDKSNVDQLAKFF